MDSETASLLSQPYISEFLVALVVCLTGFLAYARVWINNKLKPIAKEVSQTNKQVTNNHEENFREEMSGSLEKLMTAVNSQEVLLHHIQEMVKSQGHQLGEIKREQLAETTDRQSLDERLRELSKRAGNEHKELWEYVKGKND